MKIYVCIFKNKNKQSCTVTRNQLLTVEVFYVHVNNKCTPFRRRRDDFYEFENLLNDQYDTAQCQDKKPKDCTCAQLNTCSFE